MILRVQILWKGEPWRKCSKIQKGALVDAKFGLLLCILYLVKITAPTIEPEFPANTTSEQWNTTLALVFLMVSNVLQIFHALRLCFIVSKEESERNPTACFIIAKTWYDFSEASYVFSTVKSIITVSYVVKVAAYPWVVLLACVTVAEVLFKMWMLYTVYGWLKDLKQTLKYMPCYRFVPVEGVGGVEAGIGTEDTDKLFAIDMNGNTNWIPET